MAVPLLEHLHEVRARLSRAPFLLVLLDYDGTLTPIVDHPGEAQLESATREILVLLSQRPNTTVAILSGRSLEDLRARVGIAGLVYGGNHGLEIKGPGYDLERITPGATRAEFQRLSSELEGLFRTIPGVLVENKGLTLSVHYRLVPSDMLGEFHDAVRKASSKLSSCFQTTRGNKVYEIRPRINWDKGTASLWIRDHLGFSEVLHVYLGDDQTDEDAFRALEGGITVKIGNPRKTHAVYHLPGPTEVRLFLKWLVDVSL
jgi:trehalose-phosphatase